MTDEILHISVADGAARALVASTTNMVAQAESVHRMSAASVTAFGRALTAAAMLGCQLKEHEHALTLIVKGDGPIGSIVCTAHGDGCVKGYADNPAAGVYDAETGAACVGATVGKNGFVRVIRDMGLKEPYIGQVSLLSGEIAEDIAQYLIKSEGRNATLALGVKGHGGEIVSAGGLLVEPMPGCPSGVLDEIEKCLPLMEHISRDMLDLGGAAAFAKFAFTGIKTEIIGRSVPVYRCDCGRDRIEQVLLSMGRAEIIEIIRTQKSAEITCHFCNTSYHFDADELSAMLFRAR